MLARITVARRIPQMLSVRYNSGISDPPAGSVASSKGFSKKEKAHEDEYIHRQEIDQLIQMKKEIEQKQKELSDLQKEHEELLKNNAKP
ncbi:hypothetical protein F5887DRAFT_959765 [Amanita rubescens]|nr:hypothetical protein F5887DRAFT_959765 [Amanita rubescens]